MATLIDRVVSYFAPHRAAQRELSRLRAGHIRRVLNNYDGATNGRRAGGWRPLATDANAEWRMGGQKLRDVARDTVRNNAFAARALDVIAGNVVGSGIIPAIVTESEAVRRRLEAVMVEHFDTTAIDAMGKHDLYGLQALAMSTIVESGEVLVRMRPRRIQDGLPLPFQLQIIEPDYLDASVDGPLKSGNSAVQGIEFDRLGRVVAYHIRSEHPGSSRYVTTAQKTTVVPAEFIAHAFMVRRPGQARGVSWFAPVILRLRDFNDFVDAQLMRQKIAACFAAFVTGDEMDGAEIEDNPETGRPPVESFEPGMIEHLAPGQSISFASPPPVGDFEPFARASLREIAAGLGISYEALTGDLTNVNFSSGRMGWIEFSRNVEQWRNRMLVPQLLHPVGAWFVATARAANLVNAQTPVAVKWTAPRREMISPKDEVPYVIQAIRAGLTTRSEQLRRMGYDPAEVDAEQAEDARRADALGLVLDTDARKRTQNGAAVSSGGADDTAPAPAVDDAPTNSIRRIA